MKVAGLPRKILLLAGIVIIALFLTGFVLGPIGAEFFGTPQLLEKPKLHLPSDKVLGPITNTVLASWLTLIVLVLLFFFATRKLKEVPGRLQGLAEMAIETLLGFVESVVGKERSRMVFPVVATIFLFVLFNAWLAVLPIFGPIGFKEHDEMKALLRNASTDINQPLAIALVAFVSVEVWGLRSQGGWRYLSQFFNLRPLLRGDLVQGLIGLFVGGLEVLSHFIRIISFTFRLFGNMTAGKALLLIATFLIPFAFAIPFYGLELLIGFIQALIFSGLTLVFATIAITPHEEEH